MKPIRLILSAVLAALIGAGCDQPATPPSRPTLPYSLTSQTVAHFHWLGKKQLATTTNAANVMRIWNMPESAALETQVLNKLSTAPWRLLPHVATTNYAAAAPLLRALLDDCVQAESYLEIRATTNQPGELAFAIRLPAGRAEVWQTNLATVLESLTGLRPTPSQPSTLNSQPVPGWSLKKHDAPNLIELTRVGEWIVVGLGQDRNALAGDFTARILRNHTPLMMASADSWLDTRMDLRRVAEAFKLDWKLPEGLPEISMQIAGDGQNVQTRGILDFPQPLNLALEPWNLPTNLIRGRLGSFTALRGFAPWLGAQPAWNDLQIGPAPSQFFVWASRDVPLANFLAASSLEASNSVSHLSELLLRNVEPRLKANNSGHLETALEFHGLKWSMIPFATPFLQSVDGFVFAGLLPNTDMKARMPPAMLEAINPANLVYYDWEATGSRVDFLFQTTQLARLLFHKRQLQPDFLSTAWLLANTTNLGTSTSAAFQIGPDKISFSRRSSVGFTAIELHLLADWMESPQFPKGLNSLQDALRQPGKRKAANADQMELRPKNPGSSAP